MLEDIEIMRSFIFGLFFASSLSYADIFLLNIASVGIYGNICHTYFLVATTFLGKYHGF
jgi:hypothetical protein